MQYDVAIVGGSFAGLSAALQIARGKRRVVVVDAGLPRNRFASHSHGFLTRDGATPPDMLREARRQLLDYPTAEIVDGIVEAAEGQAGDFSLRLAGGNALSARRLVLAGGVSDTLPDIPGLAGEWGRRVIHCPYCHGYEFGDGPFGVLATEPMAFMKALLVSDWGPVKLFLNDALSPDAEQTAKLSARGVSLVPGRVEGVSSHEDGLSIQVAGAAATSVAALFVAPKTILSSDLPHQLGCTLAEGPMGAFISVDERKNTNVPGVFAAGDIARPMPTVALAVADGAMAGAAAHQSLIFE
ncbi:NAD(P)/FAD-dependent oxidoreductase [Mesorhizobium australicum]|uniref:Thioredoxin reductase n=1 Tax=Mesorhizobium australicum TaxID=536018 RepID=A0A1X7Q221_9HYPH|nr:NAD(P)/FAD-dependent oxidoreductase [Mesorhizobium australicum]SMH57904.1 Thioredoxin reductase [Mesorhizobium australicum]